MEGNKMRIPIVNEQDEIIGYKEKKDLTPLDINRDTGLWIIDENDNILLAQRSSNKKVHPNLWTVAVAGTVEEGETYESNVIKEAEEEIGLVDINPTFICTLLKEGKYKRMGGMFKVLINHSYNFKVEPMEISEIRWFSKSELEKLFQTNKEMFTPGFPDYYNKFISYESKN